MCDFAVIVVAMSLFRKPKKIQRRVFTACDNDEEDEGVDGNHSAGVVAGDRRVLDEVEGERPPATHPDKKRPSKDVTKNSSGRTNSSKDASNQAKSLLSFADEGKSIQRTYFPL